MSGKGEAGVWAQARQGVAPVAIGLAGLMLLPQGASAQEEVLATAAAGAAGAPPSASQAGPELRGVTVVGRRVGPESPKYTAPLLDTPQTITVVSSQAITAQNLLTLREVLSTVPGITFGAGEGGGGYGDSVNLRGYSANNDITTDGLRDSAQYTRSDPFNLQQVEIVNGANSVYSGSGSVGGAINLVTKTPTGSGETVVTGGLGTDSYRRATVDSDLRVNDLIAVRLNAMVHANDVPGREVEKYERWGVAPSVAIGGDGPTEFTLGWFHQEDDNIPQYGVPYFRNAFNNGPLPDVDPSNYYGYRNIDRQEITVNSVTARFRHEFSADLAIRNITRWQEVKQLSIVDPPQGTWCLASGVNPATGDACATPGFYQPSGPRGNTRDTRNTLLTTQTDITWLFDTGPVSHTLNVGFSASRETYHLDTGNVLRNPLGATPNPTLPLMDIADPDNVYGGPVNFIRTGISDGELSNQAVYAFDTMEFSRHWELNLGLRYERNEGEFTTATIATPYPAPPATPVVTQSPVARNKDNLFSYRAGLVFKPAENASIYVAYGNSRTPSQASVNGTCAAQNTFANCDLDPEKAVNYEIGGKLELYEGRLLMTAALFRNERTNFRVASGDPLVPEQQLDGEARVDGLALGVTGAITDRWSVTANYTYLDSEVIQSISDIAIGGGAIDFQAGDPLPNTPNHALSLWTTYNVTDAIQLGYGATYSGSYSFARASATSPLFKVPGHWLHSAALIYNVTERAQLQVNVKNIFDKEYYMRVRNNGWATPGDARSATVAVSYRF